MEGRRARMPAGAPFGLDRRPGRPDPPPDRRRTGRCIMPHAPAVAVHGDPCVVAWIADRCLTERRRVAR